MIQSAVTRNITLELHLLADEGNNSKIVQLQQVKEGVFSLFLNNTWTDLKISDLDNLIDMFQQAKEHQFK